jgi:hypothetical protein
MDSNAPKTAMPIVAGILSIVSGAFKLLGLLVLLAAGFLMPFSTTRMNVANPIVFFAVLGVLMFILGVLAVVGGVYTLQRKNFGLSLAGAIAALLPFNLLGLASVILVALSRKEIEG